VPEPGLTLPVLYLRHLADQLHSMGAELGGWLARSHLCQADLADPSLTIPLSAFRQLVIDGIELTNEPALGLLVGRRLSPLSHGMLGYAAINSGSLRQAVEVFERYTRLRISLVSVAQVVHRSDVQIRFTELQPLGELRRPLLEAMVLTVKNVMDSISMGAFQATKVAFAFAAPSYADLARELFGCEVSYQQSWTGFAIPSAAMDVPLRLADAEAFREAALICQRELDKLAANESLAARVRRLLLERQPGFPSLAVTARLFHLAPRTLHRRLLDEGTSFRAILDDVRHALAVEHIKAGRTGIEELAYLLGYSDLANFRRAFKRWEAMPPSAFRSQEAARGEAPAPPPTAKRRGRRAAPP
jgi:AraC-like DNA-binding protein